MDLRGRRQGRPPNRLEAEGMRSHDGVPVDGSAQSGPVPSSDGHFGLRDRSRAVRRRSRPRTRVSRGPFFHLRRFIGRLIFFVLAAQFAAYLVPPSLLGGMVTFGLGHLLQLVWNYIVDVVAERTGVQCDCVRRNRKKCFKEKVATVGSQDFIGFL